MHRSIGRSSTKRGPNRASSVLNKNGKLYGAKNCLTKNKTTCWNSDGIKEDDDDDPIQWLQVEFDPPVKLVKLGFQWQAGFLPEQCRILGRNGNTTTDDSSIWKSLLTHDDDDEFDYEEFDDVHAMQFIQLLPTTQSTTTKTSSDSAFITSLRLEFKEFTDFYGRITLYQLQAWGLRRSQTDKDEIVG